MITGPPPKFHEPRDILSTDPHGPRVGGSSKLIETNGSPYA